jgi:hypothetical protein
MTSNTSPDTKSSATSASVVAKQARTRRSKTWSSFGNLGRKPSEYEVVTHNMNHTVTGPTPLEMGPEVHGNQWLKKHRDGIALQVTKSDSFRDPDQMTYRKYTQAMDEQETYIDGLIREFGEVRDGDKSRGSQTLDLLALTFTPTRYLGHGLQMISAYVQQLAHSSYMANCAAFQTADQLRRVQRVAYRTRQLANAYPARGFGSRERATWEKDVDWQPMREALEQLLVTYDWDQAFVGLNLVVKPLADELFLKEFGEVARLQGDELDAMIADNLFLDAQRSRRWTIGACRALIDAQAENRSVLQAQLAQWRLCGAKMIESGALLLARHASVLDARGVVNRVNKNWETLLTEAGLGTNA